MTDILLEGQDDAATPITPEERLQLRPTYITTRAELNQAEERAIADADRWAFGRRRDVLDVAFLKRLHGRMLTPVWRWAGQYRTTARNLGIDAYRIETALFELVDDVRFWVASATYEPDEIALRFHHRLVAIHPFPNGNGRHARLAADLLIVALGGIRFSWGRENLVEAARTRREYIGALQAADRHDMAALLRFARS